MAKIRESFYVRWFLATLRAVSRTAGAAALLVAILIGAVVAYISPHPPGQDALSAAVGSAVPFILATLLVLAFLFIFLLADVARRMELAAVEQGKVLQKDMSAREVDRPVVVRLAPSVGKGPTHGRREANLTIETDDPRPILNARCRVLAISEGSKDEATVDIGLPWANSALAGPTIKTFTGVAQLPVAVGGPKGMWFGGGDRNEVHLAGQDAGGIANLQKDIDYVVKIQVMADNIVATTGCFRLRWTEVGPNEPPALEFTEDLTVATAGRSV